MNKKNLFLPVVITLSCITACNNNKEDNIKTVYLNYGENVTRTEKVKVGDEYSAPTDVETAAFTFNGWYLNPAYSPRMQATFPMKIVEDVTLYAKWSLKTFWITYDYMGHGDKDYQVENVYYGYRAPKVTPKNEEKWEFKYWCADKALTKKFDFNTLITQDYYLYAKWSYIQ